MSTLAIKADFEQLLRFLEYTLHELPVGVLYGINGADKNQCAELMGDTYRLEKLSKDLSVDCAKFIEDCRWHYERYPHYLSRYKHFGSYEAYIKKYNGPTRVKA
jgi:hypothetical protein